ncbi:MAG: hypothetical protein KC912_01170 [Proteobacteria bacterium]|nr:hypothetical protein [Pseudomonadota bacterium]
MIRLTLRSGRDGRFLARVIEQNGFPYVLDFGDERIIDDVGQRLHHGFTMWRFGRLVTAAPGDPDLLLLLSEFYSGEGLLVFLDEPGWIGREVELPVSGERTDPAGFAVPELDDLGDKDPETEWAEPETEIVDPSSLSSEVAKALGMPDPELEALMEAPEPRLPISERLFLPDLEFDDPATEELPTLELDDD